MAADQQVSALDLTMDRNSHMVSFSHCILFLMDLQLFHLKLPISEY